MAELSGSLQNKDLLAIIEFLGNLGQTGSLQLVHEGWTARLDFRDGRVIAASFADARGLGTIASLAQLTHAAEFLYEGEAPSEPVRRLGGSTEKTLDYAPNAVVAGSACPKLGFADDPASSFERPTAVHRCFATGSIQSVSILEQREFCLSGEYPGCPRYAAAGGSVGGEKPARHAQSTTANGHAMSGHGASERSVPTNGTHEPPPPDNAGLESRLLPIAESPPRAMPQVVTVGAETSTAAAPVEPGAPQAPGAASELFDRLLPPLAIVLAIAALIAVFVVFIRPQL